MTDQEKLLRLLDVLYCIRSRQSKTYGSGWTADQAEKIIGSENVFRWYV